MYIYMKSNLLNCNILFFPKKSLFLRKICFRRIKRLNAETTGREASELHRSWVKSASLPRSTYVVTNDKFIFLQSLCICKTAEVHQDVKWFLWPPRLPWKGTRWKYHFKHWTEHWTLHATLSARIGFSISIRPQ